MGRFEAGIRKRIQVAIPTVADAVDFAKLFLPDSPRYIRVNIQRNLRLCEESENTLQQYLGSDALAQDRPQFGSNPLKAAKQV